MTHKSWLLHKYPNIWSTDIADYEERQKKHQANRVVRDKELMELIKDENSVGWQLKDFLDDLCKKLTVPKKIEEDHKLYNYLKTYYCIVPSFFKMYQYMEEEANKEDPTIDFKLVFRTFGDDHKMIYDEFSEYLLGRHPLFTNPHPVTKITSAPFSNCGNILRSTADKLDIVLISGMFPNKYLAQEAKNFIFDKEICNF